jgi:hypothetical protein
MAWPNGTRYKTYAPGSSFPPADPNAIQDQILQVAGYRGKYVNPAAQSTSSTSYTTLTTPDQVTGIVLPTDALIAIAYQATWQESVSTAARAAIFIGANQLKVATSAAAPAVQETLHAAATPATDRPLVTNGLGLFSDQVSTAYTGDVTTGQIVGQVATANQPGVCYVFAAAGTYTVSVQFKASSGSVTVKNRSLRVWTVAFD